MSVYDHYDLDPVSISQRLDDFPADVDGQAQELYELAETHFDAYRVLFYQENMVDKALYELEDIDELLERAERDLQLRNRPVLEEGESK